MPLYEITAPDGSTYEIEGPEGASQQSLILAAKRYERQRRSEEIQRRLIESRQRPPEAPETTFGGYFKEAPKAVGRGAINLLETAGTGISALLPEDTEKSAREAIKELAGIAKKPLEAGAGYEDTVATKLFEGLGSTLPFFLAGPLGLAGRVGAAGLGVSAGAGEARVRAEQEGATAEQRSTATLMGAPTGLLDLLAPNIGPLKNIITTALARGGIEGATEAAQQVAQNLIAKGIYKPEQAVVEGAAEEGAYGAGVGAIASVILDLTLGRRARGAGAAQPTATPGEEGTPTTGALPMGPTAERPQGELFPEELDTAQRELAAVMGPQRPVAEATAPAERTATEAGQMSLFEGEAGPSALETAQPDLFGEIVPRREEAAAEAAETTTPARETQTRDMIDELETQQIEELEAEEQSARLRKELETQKADAEKQRLKMESDIAELDGQIAAKEQKTTEDKRLQLLLPIIASDTRNIPKTFVNELKREGFTNTNLTDRERNLINRAYDVRLAEEPVPVQEPAIEQPKGQVEELEAQVPEKKVRREPEQMSFPGMGKPKGKAPEAFSEEELAGQEAPFTGRSGEAPRSYTSTAPFVTTLTPEVLDKTGLPKQSGFYKQLLGMDMADKNQWPAITNIFARVRQNPNVTQTTKDAIENMAMQAFGGLAKQQELFAPEKKGAKKPAQEKPSEPTGGRGEKSRTDGGAAGARAEDRKSVVPKPAATERPAGAKPAEKPQPAGLGDRGQPVRDAGERKGVEPGALKKEPEAEAKTEPKAEKPAAKTEAEAKKAAPKAEKPAAKESYGWYGQLAETDRERALDDLAFDMYIATFEKFKLLNRVDTLNEINAKLSKGEMPEVAFGRAGVTTSVMPLSGGKYAKSFYNSLSNADRAILIKKMQNHFGKSEAKSRVGTEWFAARQALDRAVQEQVDGNPELTQEAVRVFMPLHPEIVRAVRAGDLTGALNMLAKHMGGRNGKIAEMLAGALKGVKVKAVKDLKSPSGRALAGDFDVASNTVRLDDVEGMNAHTLLHEATHAAVLSTLTNKSHPMTKQLTELYNSVKDSLDSAYGAKSVEEFASEAMSNPDFQQRLAQINPKGEPISALRRFFNSVGNMLRRMIGLSPKGLDSALDSADVLIGNIIAPGVSSLGNGTLYQASTLGTAKDVFKALDNKIIKMPGMDNAFVGGIYEFLRGSVPKTTKTVVLRSLPLNALTEVASRDIPMAKDLDTLEKEWNGAIDERRRDVDAAMHHIQKWIKGNPEKEVVLNRVVSASTLAEVDPSKPRDSYKGKQTKGNEDKQVVWDKLQADWKTLGAEGQAVYKQMRNAYAESHEKLLDLLLRRIDDSVADKKEASTLKTEIYQRLALKGKIDPYFPLMRQGDYWVTFNAKGPDGNLEYYKMAFPNSVERDRAILALKADPDVDAKSVQESTPTGKRDYKSAPPTAFVNNILRVLAANEVSENVTDEIMRVFLDTLPESSFAQAFRTRLGTLGFDTDATRVFYKKSISMAHQLGNLEYGAKMYKLRDAMEEHVNTKANTEEARLLFDTLGRHIKTMVAPDIAPWSKAATSTAFGFTLGFNVSSALVNLTQLPMVVMPYLGGQYGFTEANKALGYATRTFLGSGLKRTAAMAGTKERVGIKAGYSLDNYNFIGFDDAVIAHVRKTGKAPTAQERLQIAEKVGLTEDILDLRELAEMSSKYGLLSRSVAGDILEMGKDDSVLTRINNWSGFVFHHGERMNRQVSLIAAYKLELDRMRKGGKKLTTADRQAAAQEAIRLTELLNGGASANSAPLLAKSSLGKIVFMYKRYGVSMYYMLFKTTRDAMSAEDPEVRKAAKRQIAGVYATSALLAGAQGVPMFGVAAALYNLFGKEDDEDDFETAARKYMGEGMFNGALNYLTGTAVANRVGLTDLLLHSTGYRDQDNAILSFLQLAGGPVYGVADRIIRGGQLIMDGETQRGLEQVMPAAFSNVMKGYRFATEGANTLRGDPIVGDIGAGHTLAQAFGFAPAEYTRQLEVTAAEKNVERRVLEERTKLLRKYYVALRMGDSDGAQDVMKDLLEMAKKRPWLVTHDTIKKSMAQHMRTTSTMYHGVTLNKLMRAELLRNAAEFDSDVTIFKDEGEE